MATIADPPRPVGASESAVRHGTCRLTVRIGGMDYRLRPMPPPPGFAAVWVLRKLDPHGPAVRYAVAAHRTDPDAGCTCPDHEYNKSVCKHIMALRALGLIPKPKGPRKPRARKATPAPVPAHANRLPEGWVRGGAA